MQTNRKHKPKPTASLLLDVCSFAANYSSYLEVTCPQKEPMPVFEGVHYPGQWASSKARKVDGMQPDLSA